MMNRELRRAQAKQDKKAEREKDERRAARRRKVDTLRARRSARREQARTASTKKPDDGKKRTDDARAGKPAAKNAARGRNPGRFAGALMMATVFFIVLQGSVPPDEGGNDLLRSVTGAGFYLLFGYFAMLWLMRRDAPRPLVMTLASGVMLTAGVEVAKLFQPEVATDPVLLALALPGLVGGAFLGRLVYTSAPT
ncbi:MAG: hypothetical protein P1P87_04965 [Trueperaceae bacterium]|nr:hypothetical protein [Trueperaceae bacterium]